MSHISSSNPTPPLATQVKRAPRGLNLPAPIAILLVLIAVAGASWYVYQNVFYSQVIDKSQYDISPNGNPIRTGGRGFNNGGGFVARPMPVQVDPNAALNMVREGIKAEIQPNSGLGVLTPGRFVDIRIQKSRVRFNKGDNFKADFAITDVSLFPIQDRNASIAKWNAIQPNSELAKRANVTEDQINKLKGITFPPMVVSDEDRNKMIEMARKYAETPKDAQAALEPDMIKAFREIAVNSLKPTQDAYHAAAEQVKGILDSNQFNMLRTSQ